MDTRLRNRKPRPSNLRLVIPPLRLSPSMLLLAKLGFVVKSLLAVGAIGLGLWLSGCGSINYWMFEKAFCRTDLDVMGWTICGPSLHDPNAVRK